MEMPYHLHLRAQSAVTFADVLLFFLGGGPLGSIHLRRVTKDPIDGLWFGTKNGDTKVRHSLGHELFTPWKDYDGLKSTVQSQEIFFRKLTTQSRLVSGPCHPLHPQLHHAQVTGSRSRSRVSDKMKPNAMA